MRVRIYTRRRGNIGLAGPNGSFCRETRNCLKSCVPTRGSHRLSDPHGAAARVDRPAAQSAGDSAVNRAVGGVDRRVILLDIAVAGAARWRLDPLRLPHSLHFDCTRMESTRWSRLAVLYASTIFLSAFLLFQVQPLISRFILPWFGGSPAVWTTCLLFFQTVLFAGYAYAHVSEHYFRPKVRTIVHLTLIVAALLTLPITPSDGWKPADSGYPTARILALLAVCVGLPYFVLASTGPLVQAWFSRAFPGRSPYRLYSLSNFGSLLALLSYPFVVEPALDGHAQSLWWTAGFVLFCLLCGTACWQTAKLDRAAVAAAARAADAQTRATSQAPYLDAPAAVAGVAGIRLDAADGHDQSRLPGHAPGPVSVGRAAELVSVVVHHRLRSRALVSAAAVWAGGADRDLSDGRHVQSRRVGSGLVGIRAPLDLGHAAEPLDRPRSATRPNVVCQFAGLFLLCMLCHGELVRLRPAPRYLTSFYLMISAGGALGGLSVSLVAPQVFNTYAEWKIGLAGRFRAGRDRGLRAGRFDRLGPGSLEAARGAGDRVCGACCGSAACWRRCWRWSKSFNCCEMTSRRIIECSNRGEIFMAS